MKQGAQYPNKMIQKIQKQAKLMQLPTLCQKYYWMMKSQDINSVNPKQSRVFNKVHKRAKEYVKYNGHNLEPVDMFLSSSGSRGKSHLVKTIYDIKIVYKTIPKAILYHCKD